MTLEVKIFQRNASGDMVHVQTLSREQVLNREHSTCKFIPEFFAPTSLKVKSRFMYVTLYGKNLENPYRAYKPTVKGKQGGLGYFATDEEAARAVAKHLGVTVESLRKGK